MKPVFVSDQLGCLYQTGYRQLEHMNAARRAFLLSDIKVAIAVSDYVSEHAPVQIKAPFGDNKRWAGPSSQLLGAIYTASDWLSQGQNVMVYCYYGRNRSGLVSALIIRDLLKITGAEALARLRMARKGAVGGNQHFVDYLLALPVPTPEGQLV